LQRCWTQSLSTPSIDLGLARAWVAAVVGGEVALNARAGEAETAEAARAAAGDALVAAIARAEAAGAVTQAAGRKLNRIREESLLAEIDDRTARRSLRP
jgi:hypothetical protein